MNKTELAELRLPGEPQDSTLHLAFFCISIFFLLDENISTTYTRAAIFRQERAKEGDGRLS